MMLNEKSEAEIKEMVSTVFSCKRRGYGKKKIINILKREHAISHHQAMFFAKNFKKFTLSREQRKIEINVHPKKSLVTFEDKKNDAFFRSVQGGGFSPR